LNYVVGARARRLYSPTFEGRHGAWLNAAERTGAQYVAVNAQRMQVRSFTTRIAEVEDPDTAREREKPVGHDNGFLWRFNNYCSIEGRPEGAYVQCESISLSRSIPTGLGG